MVSAMPGTLGHGGKRNVCRYAIHGACQLIKNPGFNDLGDDAEQWRTAGCYPTFYFATNVSV